MAHKVTLIPGDGIGPELAEATRRVLDASGVEFEWEVMDAGEAVMAKEGTPLPQAVLDSILRNKVAIKGPITTPVGVGFRSVNVALRQTLGLYANLRPVRSIPGLKTRYDDIDLVVVRENTEDLYAGIEHMVGPDAAESIKIITRAASERIARFAFEYAVANGRRKVTAVHKANIMKFSDGLFLDSCRTIAAQYEGRVAFEDRIVDNCAMQLVRDPSQCSSRSAAAGWRSRDRSRRPSARASAPPTSPCARPSTCTRASGRCARCPGSRPASRAST